MGNEDNIRAHRLWVLWGKWLPAGGLAERVGRGKEVWSQTWGGEGGARMVLNAVTWDSPDPLRRGVRHGALTINSGRLRWRVTDPRWPRTGVDVGLGRDPSPGAVEGCVSVPLVPWK